MQILVDTKPRFRAETERMPFDVRKRRSAAWRYKHWTKGPIVPNSVVIDLHAAHPFRGLWHEPGEIAIMQSGEMEDWLRMLQLLKAFARAHIQERERRTTVDEAPDFYGRTTFAISMRNDVFYEQSRKGRERLFGVTLGSQYVHALPPLVRNMASRTTLYHLDADNDMKYLNANGIPGAKSPEGDFVFRQWRKERGGVISAPLTGRLTPPQSYLDQLVSAA